VIFALPNIELNVEPMVTITFPIAKPKNARWLFCSAAFQVVFFYQANILLPKPHSKRLLIRTFHSP